MVLATELADWSDFFVAETGAAAALAGLLFVAMSVNVREILAFPWLPRRAVEMVLLLVGALLAASAGLVPDLSEAQLGAVLLVVWLATWASAPLLEARALGRRAPTDPSERERTDRVVQRLAMFQLATVPGVVGSIVVLAGSADGLYLVAAAVLLAFVVAVINAWVLLIEILR